MGALTFLIALVSIALQMQEKLTFSLDAPLNKDDVLTTLFRVTNSGELPLEDVRAAFFQKEMKDANGNVFMSNRGWIAVPVAHEIKVGEVVTLPPFFASMARSNSAVVSGEFGVIVTFRPAFWPFKESKAARFVIMRQPDGRSRFVQQPAGNMEKEFKSNLQP